MPQPWEMNWAEPPPAPALAEGAKPWEMNWGQPAEAPKEEKGTLRKIAEGLTGGPPPEQKGITAESFWPVRLGKQIAGAVKSAVTAPRDVLEGTLDPISPEGIKRAMDVASVATPINPAARAGDLAMAGAARRSPGSATAITPNLEAATTAAELGAPLPAGLVSENRGVQALTQATRQLPLVGAKIDERLAGTVGKAGEAVTGMAEDLAGGTPDRATAGANLRPSLKGAIESNKSRINDVYDTLKNVIDPEKGVELKNTASALRTIAKEREKAGLKPAAGLEDVVRLVKEGGSPGAATTKTVVKGPGFHIAEDVPGKPLTGFNGIQRARSAIGEKIDFPDPHGGYSAGDLKRIYAAMSADMHKAARESARPGVHPDQASLVLNEANKAASGLIENNRNLQKLLNLQSDERLAGSVINAAQDKTGNARLLAQLRSQMPKQDFEQITGTALREIGHNQATGEFSLNKFATGWDKMGDTAKSVLFPDPAHRRQLDSIANLGKTLKGGDQYRNTSNTGRAATTGAILGTAAPAVMHAIGGDVGPLAGLLGSLGGGYVLAKALARPATAASIERWTQALRAADRAPSQRTAAMLTIATRNMMSNMEGIPGFSKQEFLQRLQSPVQPATDNKKLEPKRITEQYPR